MVLKIKLFFCFVYFICLYIIAFCSNLKYREADDILWIGRNQWKAIWVIWLPSLIISIK